MKLKKMLFALFALMLCGAVLFTSVAGATTVSLRADDTVARARLYQAILHAENALAPGNEYPPAYEEGVRGAVYMAEMVYENLGYAKQGWTYPYDDRQVDEATRLLNVAVNDEIRSPEQLILMVPNTEYTGDDDNSALGELRRLIPHAEQTLQSTQKIGSINAAAMQLAFFYNIACIAYERAYVEYFEDDFVFLLNMLSSAYAFYYPPEEPYPPYPTEPTVVIADEAQRTALKELMEQAAYILAHEYPDEKSYQELTAAYQTAKALYEDENAGAQAMDDVCTALSDSIQNQKNVDFGAMQELRIVYRHDSSESLERLTQLLGNVHYTLFEVVGGRGFEHDSLLKVYHAYTKAKQVYEYDRSYTDEQIDAAYNELKEAYDALTVAQVDVDALWAAIVQSDYYFERKERYTEDSFYTFRMVYNGALPTYYYSVNQEDIDAVRDELLAAIGALELKYNDKHGDADLDGDVSIFDATHIQRALADFFEPSERERVAADIDDSGTMDIYDVICIQRLLAELPVDLPWYREG